MKIEEALHYLEVGLRGRRMVRMVIRGRRRAMMGLWGKTGYCSGYCERYGYGCRVEVGS